jgi:hypothetical protein
MEPLRGRRKNHRLFPGAKHRADLALTRQQEAKERQTAYDQLSVQEKLDRLPTNGANKQRARLTTLLARPVKKNEEVSL